MQRPTGARSCAPRTATSSIRSRRWTRTSLCNRARRKEDRAMGMRVAVDIGGTFTDFITVDGEGRVRVYKTSSTPRSPEQAVFKGIEALAQDSGLDVNGFLADVDLFIHGTTIATN